MGVALRQASPDAEALFQLADQISGLPIGELCARGPLEDLTRTDVAQVAVVVTSMAAATYLESLLGQPANGRCTRRYVRLSSPPIVDPS